MAIPSFAFPVVRIAKHGLERLIGALSHHGAFVTSVSAIPTPTHGGLSLSVSIEMRTDQDARPIRMLAPPSRLSLQEVRDPLSRGPNDTPGAWGLHVFELEPSQPGRRTVNLQYLWAHDGSSGFDAVYLPTDLPLPLGSATGSPVPLTTVSVGHLGEGVRELRVVGADETSVFSVLARHLVPLESHSYSNLLGSAWFAERTDHRLQDEAQRFELLVEALCDALGLEATQTWALVMRSEYPRSGVSYGGPIVRVDPTPLMEDGAELAPAMAAHAASAWFGAGVRLSGRRAEALRSAICMALGLRVAQQVAPGSPAPILERVRRKLRFALLAHPFDLAQGRASNLEFARTTVTLYERLQSKRFESELRALVAEFWGHLVPSGLVKRYLRLQ